MYFKFFLRLNFLKLAKLIKRFFAILDKSLISGNLKGTIFRLLCSFFISLPVLAFFLFSLINSFYSDTKKIIEARASQIELIENLINDKIGMILDISKAFTLNEYILESVKNRSWGQAIDLISSCAYQFDFVDTFFLADMNGTIKAGSNEGFNNVIGKNYANSDWYLGVVRSGDFYVSNLYKRDNLPQTDIFTIAVIIKNFEQESFIKKININESSKDKNKEINYSNLQAKNIGILAIQVKPEIILEWLKNIPIYQNQIFYFVDKNNKLITYKNYNLEKEINDFFIQTEIKKIKNTSKGSDYIEDFNTGKKYLVNFKKCNLCDWVIATVEIEDKVFNERNKNLHFNLAVNLVIFCFTFIIIYLLFMFAINNRKSWIIERRLSSYIQNTSDAIISIDLNGNITFFNKGAEIIFGYKFNEINGKSLSILMPLKLKDKIDIFLKKITNMVLKDSTKPNKSYTRRMKLLNKFGKTHNFLISISPVYDLNKNIKEITLIGKDITRSKKNLEYIKKLNRILLDKTIDLENLNKELKAFSYSVAHDLRAPLRSIIGFSQTLFEDNFNQLDNKGKDYLNKIKNAAKKMSSIIDDLLKLSFVSRKPIVKKEINLSNICLKIINSLVDVLKNDYEIKTYEITKQKINENEINLKYGQIYKNYEEQININIEALYKSEYMVKSPDFLGSDNIENGMVRNINIKILNNVISYGDEELIEIMLFNLLDNAFKFTSKKSYSLIEFGVIIKVEEENNKYIKKVKKYEKTKCLKNKVYFIKDNGVGFDMNYIEKLFNPFQRLHSEKDFPGTGIGLSIVKRIISRHDGNVWAESVPDNYTVFYFTLSDSFE